MLVIFVAPKQADTVGVDELNSAEKILITKGAKGEPSKEEIKATSDDEIHNSFFSFGVWKAFRCFRSTCDAYSCINCRYNWNNYINMCNMSCKG